MAKTGDCIESPLLRDRIVFRRTAADTDGELLEIDDFASPGNLAPVVHIHAKQQEVLEVLAGRMWGTLDGKERVYEVGERLIVEPGSRHTWRNAGDSELHVRATFRPAGHAERFFETVFGLTRDGLTDAAGVPQFLQIMAWTREYEIFVPDPPLPLQRALSTVLRPVAHWRGYKAWYPKYSPDAPTIV